MNEQQVHSPDLARATRLVLELMAIPGRSGEEGAVADFVSERLAAAGAPRGALRRDSAHRRTPLRGQTGNLILRLRGTRRVGRRLFSAHLDTVPICVGSRPVRDNRLVRSGNPASGLGADNRAGTAVLLAAALEILEHGLPHPPLTFCWFVQEEIGIHGARCVSKNLLGKPLMAFNWDGGSPYKLTVAATGGYRMQIVVDGLAAHAGGAPEWGVSAITIAGLAIARLHRDGWLGAIRKGKQEGTSNIGVIQGGDATNVVTDRVVMRAEARSHDARFRQRIVDQIGQAFHEAAGSVTNVAGAAGRATIEGRLDYDSYRLDRREPCVRMAADAIRQLGRTPDLSAANGGLDANWLNRHGIPTVSLGCGQLNQHTLDERLDLDGFEDACRLALRLATVSDAPRK